MKDDTAYLQLMLDAFRKINSFTQDMDGRAFFNDEKTQSAVIMQFEVIGQLAKKVSEKTRNAIDIPWKQMSGMRDWVAHDYFSFDMSLVWQTVRDAAPVAEAKITAHLS